MRARTNRRLSWRSWWLLCKFTLTHDLQSKCTGDFITQNMITTKQLIGAAALGLASFVTTTSVFAQPVEDSGSSGLIGKRYVGADFVTKDYRDLNDNGYGGSLLVNQPVSDVVDISGRFSYTQLDNKSADLTQTAFEVGTVFYTEKDGYKPFMSASLGYGWDEIDYPAPLRSQNEEGFIFSVGAGVEVPLTDKTAAIGEFSYRDGTDSNTEDSWGLELGLNHWVTEKIALKGSVYIVEDDSVTFRIGARLGF
jgi:hypothetical protein